MKPELIFLDIDGTLTNSKKEITRETFEVLQDFQRNGTRLVLASARPSPGLFKLSKELFMPQYGGILMSYNGGRIVRADTNETLFEISMDMEKTREILRFLETLPVTVILDDGKIFYVTDKNGYKVDYECRNNQMECVEKENLAEFLCFAPIKLLIAVKPEQLLEIQEKIRKFLPEELTVVRTAVFYLEIIPKIINKGQGVKDICKVLEIDPENTIAFGDAENDIPMLKEAGLGVAMGNAEETVKNMADRVTLSNDQDGIASILKSLK